MQLLKNLKKSDIEKIGRVRNGLKKKAAAVVFRSVDLRLVKIYLPIQRGRGALGGCQRGAGLPISGEIRKKSVYGNRPLQATFRAEIADLAPV